MRHHCKTSSRLLCYNSLANPSFYKHRLLSFCGTLVSRRAQIVALGDLQLPRIPDLQLLLINCVGGQGRWTFERSAVLGGITRPCSQAAGEKKKTLDGRPTGDLLQFLSSKKRIPMPGYFGGEDRIVLLLEPALGHHYRGARVGDRNRNSSLEMGMVRRNARMTD